MLKDITFQYNGVYVDYSNSYDCENYGCDDEGICRCGSIYDVCIESVDVSFIVKKIYDDFFEQGKVADRNNAINEVLYGVGKDIDIYTIDRILRSYKIWENQNWDIEIEGGYYGDEIGDVKIKENIADKIESELFLVFSLSTLKEKVEYLLNLEYGKVLPEIVDANYESITIDKTDIIFGSKGHLDKVSKKELNFYSDKIYSGIRGVVKKSGDKWKIIDGYHRIFSTKNAKVRVLSIK